MKIILSGYGKMGKMIEELAVSRGHEILAAVDMDSVAQFETLPAADVVLDFSHPAMLAHVAAYVRRTGAALLSGTTGYGCAEQTFLNELAKVCPVLYSANYSLGIAVFRKMLEQFGAMLKEGFDVEVVEKHHNQKVDAPSGTAKLLVQALDPKGELRVVTGREGMCGKREKDEIGVFALRGGTVAGEHTVYFFGEDETLCITHSASSRRIFAAGAIRAAEALLGKAPGRYDLQNVLF